MSAKTARKPKPTAKPEAETIPLAGLSITIPKPRIFSGDKEKTVTFSGEHLATALRYIALACPNPDYFTSSEGSAIELAGIADICNGLSEADLHGAPVDCHAVFYALYQRLDDLAARMNARNDLGHPELTSVTITRQPAEVV